WGSKAPQFARASGDPGEDILPPPPLPALLALAVRNPDVARWESEIAQREARVAVERSKNVPDVTIQAGPRYYGEGASAFVAGVGITLPAFGMNLGNQLDAQAQLAKSRLQKQSAEVRTAADIRRTYERLAAAYQAIKVLQQSGIPAAQAAYDGMSTGYRQGKFGLIDVLDAQRALLDARMRLLDAQATYPTWNASPAKPSEHPQPALSAQERHHEVEPGHSCRVGAPISSRHRGRRRNRATCQ
ncbi:MAG: TolC family protein, partial [Rhodospirillales bacterium]|nr:TolC family protein [Rhodospirillales bacterium]